MRFADLELIARDRSLGAFLGNTAPARTRDAYDSDESFLQAVALGYADRYTFNTADEAVIFGKQKLEDLARLAREIEEGLEPTGTKRHQPKKDKGGVQRVSQKQKHA
jgi:hypothetical protein